MKKTNYSINRLLTLIMLLFMAGTGYAQVTFTDSVCANQQDVIYGVSNSNSTSNYNWWLDDPSAGMIDSTVASNDSVIEIDWGATTGTYKLYVQETTQFGCKGDTMELDIVINPLPTVTASVDSVCEGFTSTITFEFTGDAPWVVSYTDGSSTFTDTASVTPYSTTLPQYSSTQSIDVTSLADNNACVADTSGLPTSVPVYISPKPSTGTIYHY